MALDISLGLFRAKASTPYSFRVAMDPETSNVVETADDVVSAPRDVEQLPSVKAAVAYFEKGEAEILDLSAGPETPPTEEDSSEEEAEIEEPVEEATLGDREVPERATLGDREVPETNDFSRPAVASIAEEGEGEEEMVDVSQSLLVRLRDFSYTSPVDRSSPTFAFCFLGEHLVRASMTDGRYCSLCTVKKMFVLDAMKREKEIEVALKKDDLASCFFDNGRLSREKVRVPCDECQQEVDIQPPFIPNKPLCLSCQGDDSDEETSTDMVMACVFCLRPYRTSQNPLCFACDNFDGEQGKKVLLPKESADRMMHLFEKNPEMKNGMGYIDVPVRTRCSYCQNALVFSPYVLPQEPVCARCFNRDVSKKRKAALVVHQPTPVKEIALTCRLVPGASTERTPVEEPQGDDAFIALKKPKEEK